MPGIRERLALGFGGLLLVLVVIGIQSITLLTTLGHSIDVILRENYRSVLACQEMKEALERMDSGALFGLLGEGEEGARLIGQSRAVFERSLEAELGNITLPGEAERVRHLQSLYLEYKETLTRVRNEALPVSARRDAYFGQLLPLFHQIKGTADEILRMNQQNMTDANTRARSTAAAARQRMVLLLLLGAALAVGFLLLTGRWILRPIHRLTRSADEISKGNLDLVVQQDSRDEIGRLSEAFNDMASSLRELRRSDQTRLARIRRSTQQVFISLPDAVAVIDLEGNVEVSTEAASEVFGLSPNVQISSLSHPWMAELFEDALRSVRVVEPRGTPLPIQRFVRGEERYFRPEAVSIPDGEKQPTGVILILKDVTQQVQQDEMKRGVISTVSHQLKTPLTSLRMAVYLLLEERAGPLTPKQVELLMAAREDSDRLHSILSSLLDISRIESGRMRMEYGKNQPRELVLKEVESFLSSARDRGVALRTELPGNLPEVWADPDRMGHVLSNLLSNALRYTGPGGLITLGAKEENDFVRFSVTDTGTGIPPQYLKDVFEPFFRVPDQEVQTGEGLGLAIAREIVEAHGGEICAESTPGGATTFSFTLRRADRVLREG